MDRSREWIFDRIRQGLRSDRAHAGALDLAAPARPDLRGFHSPRPQAWCER